MDLFGNEIHQLTFEEEYALYIASPQWKRTRKAKLERVGYVCEKCGVSRWSANLEVHHLHYKNFKHENLEDLRVLCPACHKGADKTRKDKAVEKWENGPLAKGFENWMDRGNNRGWRSKSDRELSRHWIDFVRWMGYPNAKYKRSSQW